MPRPIRHPTPMGATGTRSTQRTVRPPTHSTSLLRKVRRQACRARTGPRLFLGRPLTANIMLRANPQMAPNMRTKTGIFTRTPGTVGNKPSQSQTRTRTIQTMNKDPVREATIQTMSKGPARAGDSRIRAAGPRRSGEATMVGNPDRIALVARGVAEVAEVGVMVAVVSVADRKL